ncbi:MULTISPECIES: CinA family protein [Microbacterium]|uniref:Nicotinamide-nucleotide amidohydrolase PncC n=1 Tax=Microbacterium trichothecenolyticum TaxID=69370 RepID=A0A0M2HJ06_MICTR|nr:MULTISPECIES: CinA family protein [Microbacterium]KJL44297.1 Nicotinamide-nucleotide amidohydrolase PncC [Microbacterium trichothecenolyticum]MDR7189392.1 nicotinamide-nucleotide amidase [Microbacterium sp. BE35]
MTDAAAAVLRALDGRGWSIAAAESLTGGRVTATLVDVPGASAHVRGGIVAYATDIKATQLGVDADLLADRGPVDAEVAVQMAKGVRRALHADVGVATTGVAGPDPQDGKPVGTVHIAVVTPEEVVSSSLELAGTRDEIRTRTVQSVLELALTVVGGIRHP